MGLGRGTNSRVPNLQFTLAPKYWQDNRIKRDEFDQSTKYMTRKYYSCKLVLHKNYQMLFKFVIEKYCCIHIHIFIKRLKMSLLRKYYFHIEVPYMAVPYVGHCHHLSLLQDGINIAVPYVEDHQHCPGWCWPFW